MSNSNAFEADLKREDREPTTPHPTFTEAFRFWLKLGLISFGGPAGQISIMHQELVDRKRWVSNERFLNALNYCMLLMPVQGAFNWFAAAIGLAAFAAIQWLKISMITVIGASGVIGLLWHQVIPQ